MLALDSRMAKDLVVCSLFRRWLLECRVSTLVSVSMPFADRNHIDLYLNFLLKQFKLERANDWNYIARTAYRERRIDFPIQSESSKLQIPTSPFVPRFHLNKKWKPCPLLTLFHSHHSQLFKRSVSNSTYSSRVPSLASSFWCCWWCWLPGLDICAASLERVFLLLAEPGVPEATLRDEMWGEEEGEWPGVDDVGALDWRWLEDAVELDEALGSKDSGRDSGMPTRRFSTCDRSWISFFLYHDHHHYHPKSSSLSS